MHGSARALSQVVMNERERDEKSEIMRFRSMFSFMECSMRIDMCV